MRMSSVILSIGIIAAVAGCKKGTIVPTSEMPLPPPPVGAGGAVRPTAAPAAWTMDVAQLSPPSTPAAGWLGGQEFKPDKVELDGDHLVFRRGKEFFADQEIKLWLTGDHESFEGLKIDVKPDKGFAMDTPHVTVAAKKPGGNLPETQSYMEKYAMKLEFGKIEGGKLAGKIHLCLPDKDQSYLAGTFSLDAAPLTAAKIIGKITLPAGTDKIKLEAAFLGQQTGGKMQSGFVGFSVSPKDEMFVTSFASKLESKGGEIRFRHGRVLSGTYLVAIGWDKRSLAWKWVEVKGQGDVEVDLAVEKGGTGDLELTLPADYKEKRVSLLPLDADGKLPAQAGDAASLAMQLSNYIHDMTMEAAAGKATFTGLRPGTYRVVAGKAMADIVVKAGATAKAQLK